MKTRNTFGEIEGEITIRSKMRAIERESSVVSAEQRKAPLPRVTLERSLDNRRDKVPLVDHEPNGPRTPQHVDADEEPPHVVVVLLLLAQQHRVRNSTNKQRKKVHEKNDPKLGDLKTARVKIVNLGVDAKAAVVPALFAGAEEGGMRGSARP